MLTTNHSGIKMNLQLFSEGEPETPEVTEEVVPEELEASQPEEAQEEYDEIVYNKEPVKIPVSERQTYLQKGYNYDKVKSELEETKQQAQYLDRVAKFYGFDSHDEFIKSFEEAEQNKRIEAEAAKLGVPEEVIREHLQPLNQKLQSYESELKQLKEKEFQRQIEADISSLKSKYDDFEQYQEKVFAKAIEKGYSLEDAYILVSHQDKLERLGKETEQQVLARITGRDEKQVLSSNDKAGNITFDPENMSLEDIEKISERVQRGEKITF